MHMLELPLPYMNELAKQIAFISSFLGGFSVTLLGALILSDKDGRLLRVLTVSTATASLAFIVSVAAMTQMIMVTTEGYPFPVDQGQLFSSRLVGTLALLVGMMASIVTISLSGWVRSKKLGIFTTVLGSLTMIAMFLFM